MKSFSIYFIANLLSKGVGFFSLIYITHYISTDEYGELSYLLSLAALITSISMMGLPGLILTNYISINSLQKILLESKIITHILTITTLLLIILIIYLNIFNVEYLTYSLLFLNIIVSYFTHLESNILRINNKILKLSIILILSSILSLIFIMLFIEDYGILVLLLTMSIPGALFFLSYVISKKDELKKFKYLYPTKEDFNISIPMMLTSFVMAAYYFIDKQYIIYFLSSSQLAIYQVGFKFASLYEILIIQVINTIWMPIFYKKVSENKELAVKLQIKLSIIVYVLGLLVFFIPDVIWNIPTYFIDERYFKMVDYIKFIIFNAIIFQSITFLNMYFMYTKQTKVLLEILLIVILLNTFINFFTIQELGIHGVFIGNIIALSIGLARALFIIRKRTND